MPLVQGAVMTTIHGFIEGQKAMNRVGSDVYAVTIGRVTRTTAIVDGERFYWSRGKLRRGKGISLFALRDGDEWADRLDPCF